jgi:hypothetical protein
MSVPAERHETAQLGPPIGEPGAKYHAMARVVKAHAVSQFILAYMTNLSDLQFLPSSKCG